MAFDSQIIHWPTIASFVNYLAGVPRPAWCTGLTNHNTYIPNEMQWRGMTSMRSMQKTYIAKGWTSGPNLYLCATAPNPSDTGIWQMTPITHAGTHAGVCNHNHLGIENVGDFNAAPPSESQQDLMVAVNRAILKYWRIVVDRVNVHNECMPGRTCPGRYLTGAQLRAGLRIPVTRIVHAGPFGALARQDYMAAAPSAAYFPPGTAIEIDDFSQNSYKHAASGIGFIADGDLVLT